MIPESHPDGRTIGQNSGAGDSGSGEIMLFGFRVKVDPLRKSVSMNDLSDYVHVQPVRDSSGNSNNDGTTVVAVDAGYASADNAVRHQSNGGRERKRGIPWTEDEHKLFLLGLKKVGKGDWRGISRNFVKTRTPTQVASHAQKYFLRRSNLSRRRRRSSLFDITTDSVAPIPMDEEQVHKDNHSHPTQPHLQPSHQISPLSRSPMNAFQAAAYPVPSPLPLTNQPETATFSGCNQLNWAPTPLVTPIPLLPTPDVSTRADNHSNQKHGRNLLSLSLSLNLALSCDHSNGFNNGDGLISVG